MKNKLYKEFDICPICGDPLKKEKGTTATKVQSERIRIRLKAYDYVVLDAKDVILFDFTITEHLCQHISSDNCLYVFMCEIFRIILISLQRKKHIVGQQRR